MSILKRACDKGIINVEDIRRQVEEMERQEFLNMHPYKIRQDERGLWTTYLPADTKYKRKAIKRKKREDLEELIIAYYREEDKTPTFSDVFYIWAKRRLKYGEIVKATYDRYEAILKKYFSGSNNFKINEVDEDQLEDFIKTTICENNLPYKTWEKIKVLITGVFKLSKRKGYTNINITAFWDEIILPETIFAPEEEPTVEESVFFDYERDLIIEYINKNPSINGLGVIFAFETGMRCGEISALKYSDLQGNILHVQRTEERGKDETGKNVYTVRESTKGRNYKGRDIYLSDSAVETFNRIRAYNPDGEYMFINKNGKRMIGSSFTQKLYSVCNAVGVPRRSLHKTRKTYASTLHRGNVPSKLIQSQLGHKQFTTTMKYYIFNNNTEQENLQLIQEAISTF